MDEPTVVVTPEELEHAACEIDQRGYAVVPAVLHPDEVDRCVEGLEEVFDREADIADVREWHTPAYRVAYMLPAKHPTFLDLCRPGRLADLARRVLGDDRVLAGFNGLAMEPLGDGQPLHRDHPVPTPGVTLYLHAVVALDRFTAANGATRIVPGSHRDVAVDASGTNAAFEALEPQALQIELAPGDAVAYDATCVHGGSRNTSPAPRRALHVLFARRWVQPHWDVPGSLRPDDANRLDDGQRQLLGFGNTPARYDHAARRSFGYGWG